MCEPTTLAVTSLVLVGAGTAMSAYGQYQAGQYQEKIYDRNAELARRAALDAKQRGMVEASKALMEGGRVVGAAKASAAGSGADVSSASVLDALGTTRGVSQWNAETIKTNALREALGYETQASNMEAQSELARLEARYGTMGTILSGAGQMMQIGYQSNLFPKLGKA